MVKARLRGFGKTIFYTLDQVGNLIDFSFNHLNLLIGPDLKEKALNFPGSYQAGIPKPKP